jgi:choline dehydrogenase-like flavoprotein|tara:strand:- start:225 stop:482 length:258 start_codon:yes stop_codon:yes gene_type:complete
MQDTFEEVIHNMRAVALGDKPEKESNCGLENPGKIIREIGTIRMGNDSNNSVVNKFNQSNDVPNLFIWTEVDLYLKQIRIQLGQY